MRGGCRVTRLRETQRFLRVEWKTASVLSGDAPQIHLERVTGALAMARGSSMACGKAVGSLFGPEQRGVFRFLIFYAMADQLLCTAMALGEPCLWHSCDGTVRRLRALKTKPGIHVIVGLQFSSSCASQPLPYDLVVD
jgi:hypothetical protein